MREFCETCLLGQINPRDDGGGRDGRSYSYISDVSLMADGVKLRTAVQRDGRFYCEPEAEWRK